MNNNVKITLFGGLGEELLDLIGFGVLCKYLNYKSNVSFYIDQKFDCLDNKLDIRLFNFNQITISDDECNFYVNSPNPSYSLCPYRVYEFIEKFLNELTFEQFSNDFVEYSKIIIKPSEIILSKIPNDIEKAYGIHLRKKDKNGNTHDIIDDYSRYEFEITTNKLLEDVKNIIISEEETIFLIVCEDNNWKKEIYDIIIDFSIKNNKLIKILDIDYDNENNYYDYNNVLDMFCLSKCKEILQGVQYSAFSILASLLGNNKIRNYSNYTNNYVDCFVNCWSSVIEINNNKNYDTELHKKTLRRVMIMATNINEIFI